MLLKVDPLSTIRNNELIAKAKGEELETSAVRVFVSNTSSPCLKRRYEMRVFGCLSFTWKNRLVDGCCKWDASIQYYLSRLEISTGMRLFHLQNCFVNYRASLELVGVQDGGGNAANGTCIFHSEILFGNFGLPFKKFRFPVEISVQEEKNSLPIYIPSEISGVFG